MTGRHLTKQRAQSDQALAVLAQHPADLAPAARLVPPPRPSLLRIPPLLACQVLKPHLIKEQGFCIFNDGHQDTIQLSLPEHHLGMAGVHLDGHAAHAARLPATRTEQQRPQDQGRQACQRWLGTAWRDRLGQSELGIDPMHYAAAGTQSILLAAATHRREIDSFSFKLICKFIL